MSDDPQFGSGDSPIRRQTTALNASAAASIPAELLAVFFDEHAALRAGGAPDDVLAPGDTLPDGRVLDAHGAATTLSAVRSGRPSVVVFYRGGWCPYCNIALRTYQAALVGPLAERGFVLIAISPQTPDGSLSMQETNALTLTVLSDPANGIARQLGILSGPTDAVREGQALLGIDVAGANADGTDALPMPTAIVVDANGTIRWIDVHADYSNRTEPAAILAAVDDI